MRGEGGGQASEESQPGRFPALTVYRALPYGCSSAQVLNAVTGDDIHAPVGQTPRGAHRPRSRKRRAGLFEAAKRGSDHKCIRKQIEMNDVSLSASEKLEQDKLALDRRRFRFEEYRFKEENKNERFKIKWISGVAAVLIAIISTISAVTIAAIEQISKYAEIEMTHQRDSADLALRALEQQRLFLETFSNAVMNGDLTYRRDFALYVSTVSTDPGIRASWSEYHKLITEAIIASEEAREVAVSELAALQTQGADESELQRTRLLQEIARLTLLLEGGADIRTNPTAARIDQNYLSEFMEFMQSLGLRHFTGIEFLTAGAASETPGNAAYGLNTPPPRELWPNVALIARVMDEFRERHGSPVIITSAYRNLDYNSQLGGADQSQHRLGWAVDFTSPMGTQDQWKRILMEMRSEGLFQGGIGSVGSAGIHVDVRGINADW